MATDELLGRGRQIKRVIRTILLLSGRGKTIAEISEISGVCTKTVRRDIAILESIHIPIFQDYSDDYGGGRPALRWRVDPHFLRRFN